MPLGSALQDSMGPGQTLQAPPQSCSPSWHEWSPTRGSLAPHTSRTFVSSSLTSRARASGEEESVPGTHGGQATAVGPRSKSRGPLLKPEACTQQGRAQSKLRGAALVQAPQPPWTLASILWFPWSPQHPFTPTMAPPQLCGRRCGADPAREYGQTRPAFLPGAGPGP